MSDIEHDFEVATHVQRAMRSLCDVTTQLLEADLQRLFDEVFDEYWLQLDCVTYRSQHLLLMQERLEEVALYVHAGDKHVLVPSAARDTIGLWSHIDRLIGRLIREHEGLSCSADKQRRIFAAVLDMLLDVPVKEFDHDNPCDPAHGTVQQWYDLVVAYCLLVGSPDRADGMFRQYLRAIYPLAEEEEHNEQDS